MHRKYEQVARDKYILITGATSGIGKEAALALARQGAHVILHGRDRQKATETREQIIELSGNEKVDIIIADLFVAKEIYTLVDTLNSKYERLDVLINNAGGVMNKQRELTVDGWEKTIALNVLAPFLLSALLYPQLSVRPGGRIINMASMAHRMAKPNLDDFMYNNHYSAMQAYSDAKLYIILLSQEMARRLGSAGNNTLSVNSMHPGVVATNFAVDSNSLYHYFFSFFRKFLLSPEKGADTLIYLASARAVDGISGKYFAKRKPAKIRYVPDLKVPRLWNLCEQYTDIRFLESEA